MSENEINISSSICIDNYSAIEYICVNENITRGQNMIDDWHVIS